jgi:hypothetical protein
MILEILNAEQVEDAPVIVDYFRDAVQPSGEKTPKGILTRIECGLYEPYRLVDVPEGFDGSSSDRFYRDEHKIHWGNGGAHIIIQLSSGEDFNDFNLGLALIIKDFSNFQVFASAQEWSTVNGPREGSIQYNTFEALFGDGEIKKQHIPLFMVENGEMIQASQFNNDFKGINLAGTIQSTLDHVAKMYQDDPDAPNRFFVQYRTGSAEADSAIDYSDPSVAVLPAENQNS